MDYPAEIPLTPRHKRVNDRFIPHREGVNLEAAFSVANSVRLPTSESCPSDLLDSRTKENKDAHQIYSNLLKCEMFGGSPRGSRVRLNSITPSGSAGNLPNSASSGDVSLSLSPDRSTGSISGRSQNSLGMTASHSSLSLPTSPRKRRDAAASSSNMFRFSPKKLIRSESDLSDISLGLAGSSLRPESRDYLLSSKQRQRTIKPTPVKVLDAPKMKDNFYTNLVDWGSTDSLAVGLAEKVYLWNANTGAVFEVASLDKYEKVTSLAWMDSGEHIAVGSDNGTVQIYDTLTQQRLRVMTGHTGRVSALSWNDFILSSGSGDATILHRDSRIKEHWISRLESHYGEVCGLKWNKDLQQLASGGNDNKLKIWQGVANSSASSRGPLYEFDEHTAAVKALAWSPHQRGLLASGGGMSDRKIWFWNALNGKSISNIDAGSQVCSLAWNPRVKELISTHGARHNDIIIWKYPTMQPITRLRAHTHRVLHMALSPDGKLVATASADETVRLWSLFEDESEEEEESFLDLRKHLR